MLPVITISRQYGSGGHELGEKVAKELGIPYLDKQLIAMAAKEAGYSEEIFAHADERATNSLLYSMVTGSYGFSHRVTGGVGEMPINDKLFIVQSDIIKKYAGEGPCVIVGRCADYILRENNNVLRVFVHGDKAARVNRIVEKELSDRKKAPDFVAKKDKQRANYYNFYTNRRWDDINNYNLSVDTSLFTMGQAVALVIEAAKKLDK